MKHRFSLILLLLGVAAGVAAQDFKSGELYYHFLSGDSVEVVPNGDSYKQFTSVSIPETVVFNNKTYRVTSIGHSAFYNCTQLKSFTIGGNVRSIQGSAFYGCTALTQITIPTNVSYIDGGAFNGSGIYNNASNWTDGVLYIGDCLVAIDQDALPATYTVKAGTRLIAHNAFYRCAKLQTLTIAESVEHIGGISYCEQLQTLRFNAIHAENEESNNLFWNCPNVKTITIGNKVEYIPHGFVMGNDMPMVTSITLPNSVKSIGRMAFYMNEQLSKVSLGTSIETIGEYAFYGCTDLQSISLPASLTTVRTAAFGGCMGLSSVTIPENVTTLESMSFGNCTNLQTINWNARRCNAEAYYVYPFAGSDNISTFNLGSRVEFVPRYLLTSNTHVSTLHFPAAVKQVGMMAFYGCTALQSVTFDSLAAVTVDSMAFFQTSLRSLKLPAALTGLDVSSFGVCSSLQEVKYYNEQPISISGLLASHPFGGSGSSGLGNVDLLVPAAAIPTYRSMDGWCDFRIRPAEGYLVVTLQDTDGQLIDTLHVA